MKTLISLSAIALAICLTPSLHAGQNRVTISADRILLNGHPVKLIGLRCSNALISDATTDDLIDALDFYCSYGINTVSVYLMGSRFGDVKGYLPDGTLAPAYQERLERLLQATDQRRMVVIVGCLYWGTSAAKDGLSNWTQADADRAVANTAEWLRDGEFAHVILDPDNEGMAVRAMNWQVESMIAAAKRANSALPVANNTRQDPPNEDLNIHFGKRESGKPWLDSEATPKNGPGGYWGRFSKQSHQANSDFYNYSRIGRYTREMKQEQLSETKSQIKQFNGYVLASTWLQCGPDGHVGGPFTHPGGPSDLGSNDNEQAAWNIDIDQIHPQAGIRWWLEFVKAAYGPWPAVQD